jgi:hypothetical protein
LERTKIWRWVQTGLQTKTDFAGERQPDRPKEFYLPGCNAEWFSKSTDVCDERIASIFMVEE